MSLETDYIEQKWVNAEALDFKSSEQDPLPWITLVFNAQNCDDAIMGMKQLVSTFEDNSLSILIEDSSELGKNLILYNDENKITVKNLHVELISLMVFVKNIKNKQVALRIATLEDRLLMISITDHDRPFIFTQVECS